MTKREKLLFLITEYEKGNYETKTFCDQFVEIYFYEEDSSLSEYEDKIFRASAEIFARFSPFEEDVKTGALFGEERIKEELVKLKERLSLK